MKSVGLGNVLLKISLSSLSDADIGRLSSVTLILRDPSGDLSEIPVQATGLDRVGRTAAAMSVIDTRGTYRLGCRLHFGSNSITSPAAFKFAATDGMD